MNIVSLTAIPITHVDHQQQPLNYLFVRIETDDGITGYGEVCDSYGCHYPLSVRAVIDEALSPLLLGEDPSAVERLVLKMRGWTRRRLGDQGVIIQAISGVEIALWDVLGKSQGKSVSQLLGSLRDRVPIYASGPFLEEGPPEWHLRLFESCLRQGVRAIKVRTGLNFQRDLVTLRAIRSLIGDDIQIMVDGSEHYTVATALEIAKALEDLDVLFFEEPVPQHNREGIARLVEKSPVPIAYGEHLFTSHDFQDCLIHRRADVIQPDAAICGGISEARKITTLAETFGVPVVPHSAAGPMALAANLHMAASAANVRMLEYSFTLDRLWKEMLREPILSPSSLQDGCLAVHGGPGLGLLIDEEVWDRYPYQARSVVERMPTWSMGHV
jgi:L-alanine-DL-glutamate epimerase-like enolase superfamily enzyme